MDAHARKLFFETLYSQRRPVAFVGSGMSAPYGGITWQESVELALEFVDVCLNRLNFPDCCMVSAANRIKLQVYHDAVRAYRAKGALESSSDKYGALDICEEVLDRIDELPHGHRLYGWRPPETCPEPGSNVSSFRSFMAALYRNDTYLLRRQLLRKRGFNKEFCQRRMRAKR
jgi:hypothetical protein